jgi:hypothetical protein
MLVAIYSDSGVSLGAKIFDPTLVPDHADNLAALQALFALQLSPTLSVLYGPDLCTQLSICRVLFALSLSQHTDASLYREKESTGTEQRARTSARALCSDFANAQLSTILQASSSQFYTASECFLLLAHASAAQSLLSAAAQYCIKGLAMLTAFPSAAPLRYCHVFASFIPTHFLIS